MSIELHIIFWTIFFVFVKTPPAWEPVPNWFRQPFRWTKNMSSKSEACFWDFRREIPFAYGVLCDSFRKADDQASASASGSKKSPFFGRDFSRGRWARGIWLVLKLEKFLGVQIFWVSYICAIFFKKRSDRMSTDTWKKKSWWNDNSNAWNFFEKFMVNKNGVHQHLN